MTAPPAYSGMRLSSKQARSIAGSTARLNFWVGAVRSGKTFASLLRWAQYAGTSTSVEPLIMVGKTLRALKRNVLDPLAWLLGPLFTYNLYSQEALLFGHKVLLFGANDERAEQKLRGLTASGGYVDELTTIPESFFGMLLSRLSTTGAKLFGTTNPDGPRHWVKVRYLDRERDLDLTCWNFVMSDNPSLSQEYVNAISAEYVGLWYRRFILGQWCAAEGAVFDFFALEPPYVISGERRADYYLSSIDYGTTNPCCFGLFGVNGQGGNPKVWLEREYYYDSRAAGRQKTDSEYVGDFREWLAGIMPMTILIDPSAASFHVAMSRAGYPVEAANNDVLNGIRNMSRMMKSGQFAIHSRCKHTLDEMQGYSWDPKAQAAGEDKPIKLNDHCVDFCRYLTNSKFSEDSIDYATFTQM
jgi:PBSX family phage terminase large subunit